MPTFSMCGLCPQMRLKRPVDTPESRLTLLEEVEVAEREPPCLPLLRELGGVLGQPFADEADRARRRHEAGGEVGDLLAGVRQRDREVGVDRRRAAAQQARLARTDGVADDRGAEALPRRVGDDRPTVAVLEAHVLAG